jgi:pimeloyl-ACP methyl ester carboxylesterase
MVPAIDQDRRTEQVVRLAYREYRDTNTDESSIVTLVHGSPGDGRVFERLAVTLSQQHRVIVPDLPGFGNSSLEVPDYSLRAHARYVIDLLDRLRIARTHLVGFSMGGGVALNVAGLGEERIRSLVLLSGIGVQEMELLGNYHVNHAVHGVQLVALWLTRAGLPHFGLLDQPLSVAYSYARNFYDSDQRPLRKTLSRVEAPTLILHGRDDAFVPVEAAYEHTRLVPQSELHVLNEGHFLLFSETDEVARLIDAFIRRVNRGGGMTRLQAPLDRVRASRSAFDARLIPRARAVNAAVLGAVIAVTTMISAPVGSVGGGVLQGQGRSSLWLALISALVGLTAGIWFRRSRRSRPSSAARFSTSVVRTITIVIGSAVAAPMMLGARILTGLDSWSSWVAVTAVLSTSLWLLAVTLCSVSNRIRVAWNIGTDGRV